MAEGKVIKLTADEITETHGDTVFQFVTKAFETQDEFIFETIRPFCETQAHMAITKDELIRALTLLREQEPVEPFARYDALRREFDCGACGYLVGFENAFGKRRYRAKYCPECGRRVRWE